MLKAASQLAAALALGMALAAQAQIPGTVNLRYTEQISNGPAGSCGCFGLEGFQADTGWRLKDLSAGGMGFSVAADAGVVHTGSEGSSPYGLTLTTVTAGPRFNFPAPKIEPFAQVLFGFAHGSSSAFPQGNTLVSSANSFALEVGGAADYPVAPHLAVRILELEYLRTALPNSSTDWQNNLRIGAGVTIKLGGGGRR
jgi:hypothetical protein